VQFYPLAYAAGLLVMIATMLLASYFPARRAARLSIVDALAHI
jgi:ABC-type lipoprotein release transport system permease subunit